MNEKQIQNLQALVRAINGKFWKLAGNANKKSRALLIQELTGTKPRANECGINALMKHLYEKFPVDDFTCEADREYKLAVAILEFKNPNAELFVVVSSSAWGKATTLEEAAKNCKAAGARVTDTCLAWHFKGTLEDLLRVRVSLGGELEWPEAVSRERLFGKADGTERTISNILTGF